MNRVSDDMPLISVRIPAYNHERYVQAALDSVLIQDYPNKEIVIIDDGSTDGTADRIRDWIRSHTDEISVHFESRKNKGVSQTINDLLAMANGAFLVGLASDDVLLPGSLSVRYRYLCAHPEKMAVFGDSKVIDKKGNIVLKSGLKDLHGARKQKYMTDRELKKEIIQNWAVTGSVLMTRAEVHEEFKYDVDLQVEDRDFYLKLVAKEVLGYIDVPVAGYRIHGENACFDKMSRLVSSRNKYYSLVRNVRRFRWRDRILFIRPLLSSILGMLVYSVTRR